MAVDYKGTAYRNFNSKRFKSTGEREKRTSYGQMNDWQRDNDIFRTNFLEKPDPYCHEAFLDTRDIPLHWQPKKATKVVEVLKAEGKRHAFIYHADLFPSSKPKKEQIRVSCDCFATITQPDIKRHAPGCYSAMPKQCFLPPSDRHPVDVKFAPEICQEYKPDMPIETRHRRIRHRHGSLEAAIQEECLQSMPKLFLNRNETMAVERTNWQLIR